MKLAKYAGCSAALLGMAFVSGHAAAQDGASEAGEDTNFVATLSSCRGLADDSARLACYDREVTSFVDAASRDEVRIVDSDDIRDTRRRLFGFSLPRISLFGNGEDGDELTELDSTITRVRKINYNTYQFQIEEGDAWWQYKIQSVRSRAPEVGDPVTLKKATLGAYFIRVDGRRGVKGIRVQ